MSSQQVDAIKQYLSTMAQGRKSAFGLIPSAKYISELRDSGELGDEVVILAAGPSLPTKPIWQSTGYKTIALNRAVFLHNRTTYFYQRTQSKLIPACSRN